MHFSFYCQPLVFLLYSWGKERSGYEEPSSLTIHPLASIPGTLPPIRYDPTDRCQTCKAGPNLTLPKALLKLSPTAFQIPSHNCALFSSFPPSIYWQFSAVGSLPNSQQMFDHLARSCLSFHPNLHVFFIVWDLSTCTCVEGAGSRGDEEYEAEKSFTIKIMKCRLGIKYCEHEFLPNKA